MKNNLTLNSRKNNPVNQDEILKVTALLYVEEALDKEEYENVPELIHAAKELGVKNAQIRGVITKYVRRLTKGRPDKETVRTGARLRFKGR